MKGLTTSNRTHAKDADDQANEAAEDGLGFVIPSVMLAQDVPNAQQTFSKCCNSEDPIQEIADILEGFGLLNGNEATDVISKDAAQLIQSAYQQALAELSADKQKGAADIHPTANADSQAGMLEVQLPMDMQAQLKVLIKEYLCSLENASSTKEQTIGKEGLLFGLSGASDDQSGTIQSLVSQLTPPSDDAPDKTQSELFILTPSSDAGSESTQSVLSVEHGASDILETIRSTILKNTAGEHRVGMQSKSTVLPKDASSKAEAQSTAVLPLHQSSSAPVKTDGVDLAAAATAVSGADMADNIASIVARVSTQAANGAQEFTVALKPDHLGELSIKLVLDNDGIQAQIKVANPSTRGLIQNELPALTEMLRDKGINVRQIEVSYEAPAFSFDTRQGQSHGQYSDLPGKSQYAYAVNGSEPYSSVADSGSMQEILLLGSSVEFQA